MLNFLLPQEGRTGERHVMPMIPLSLMRLGALAVMSLCLAGCGKSESYRYKLTLAVDTKDGIKRGSSVGEVAHWEVFVPERGVAHKLRGEALYLDLGPGKRPLIALLSKLHPHGELAAWTRSGGPDSRFWLRLYGEAPSLDFLDDVARIARLRGPRRIAPDDLPDLVTFADISDPKTVIEVDPNDLQATLGQGVTWNEITFESTREPITSGIRAKLPWIEAYFQKNLRLDGQNLEFPKKDVANSFGWADFDQSGDLKRK
jgi:hypothetical protein